MTLTAKNALRSSKNSVRPAKAPLFIKNLLPQEIIKCGVHDSECITEAALVELINCSAVLRLKTVYQAGISANLGLLGYNVTRYEHSVGAMLLVRRANGSIEAQAAALLHDIAHTSLSHVADSVFHSVVHEEKKLEFLHKHTTVISILQKHFGEAVTEHILEESNYPLLELDAPALCADRMDYGMRDALAMGELDAHQVRFIWRDFTVVNGKFAHRTREAARLFADAYMRCDQNAWANPLHGVLYVYTSRALRLAIDKNLLTLDDFWRYSDTEFWHRVCAITDPDIRLASSRVRADLIVEEAGPDVALGGSLEQGGEVIMKQFKLRVIDPDVVVGEGGQTQRLSELDPEYKLKKDQYLNSRSGPIKLRISLPTPA